MDSKTIVMGAVALILGMLLANMLKSVCGCKTVEGQTSYLSADADHRPVTSWRSDTTLVRCALNKFWTPLSSN